MGDRRTPSPVVVAVAAVVVVAGLVAGGFALFSGKTESGASRGVPAAASPVPAQASAVESHEASPGAPAQASAGQAPSQAGQGQGSSDRAAALRDALTWTDDAQRIDAIEAMMNVGAVETLPVLEEVQLRMDPEAAPTIIHAVSVLGKKARGNDERQAAQTLGRWLHDESGRVGADARGNVSVLVDALGDLGSHEAAQALADSLDDDGLPLHVQTLAVQRLTELGDPAAKAAIDRFSARLAAMPPLEGIDESLRTEAVAVANAAEDRFQP